MAFCDFAVRYNPEIDNPTTLTKKILYSIIIKRLKAKKPTVIFISGDSGEGKSWASLRLQELLYEIQDKDLKDYLDISNIYTPLEYAEKLDKILNDKEYKKANIVTVHEARELVKAKNWHSFLNQSISDINALSRSVKRLITIIIAQFIRDIDSNVRYTITYYCKVRRPKGKPARLYINTLWKDDRDLDKPKLRKRKLSGYLISPEGKYRRYVPEYLEMSRPSKEIIEMFEQRDRESKQKIIKAKIDKLIKEISADIGTENKKLEIMTNYYTSHQENINRIGRMYRGKWRLRPEAREMHDLTISESKEFEKKLNEALKKDGEKT